MFSRTCGNHRVGELRWFYNNGPNEQFSREPHTCVGESAAQPAFGTRTFVSLFGVCIQLEIPRMLSEEVDEWHFSMGFTDLGLR